YELSDIAGEFSAYAHRLVFDPARFQEVQERLSLLYALKKKYASSSSAPISEVIAYGAAAEKHIERLSTRTEDKAALEARATQLEKQVYTAARLLSEKRKQAAQVMAQEVEAVLHELGMAGTQFSVCITEKPGSAVEQKCGPHGMDNVEFLIAANPGAPLMPLAQIASGGEISRVMLALKTVFAHADPVPTLIFDEIDTGIGGEVAVAVGSHMKRLAENHQVLCITHLASIAVYADNQIKVEKGTADGMTYSRVGAVTGEARVAEIARMLSGDADSAASREHARALLQKYSRGI
ncbi:MAG: DNA repair protein RecN, partial [Treponema sp.]|nr:DNA repair protein RecN [Treponema sp.]